MIQGFERAQAEYESKMFAPYDIGGALYEEDDPSTEIVVRIKIDSEESVDDVINEIEKITQVEWAEFIDFDE